MKGYEEAGRLVALEVRFAEDDLGAVLDLAQDGPDPSPQPGGGHASGKFHRLTVLDPRKDPLPCRSRRSPIARHSPRKTIGSIFHYRPKPYNVRMARPSDAHRAAVFISYASEDSARVRDITARLTSAGARVWLDKEKLVGGSVWAEELVRAIKKSSVVMLMCSDAAMRSWAVKQEIQVAGEARKVLLPVLLEHTNYPAQLEFFLAGRQWIEVLDRPESDWLPTMLAALERVAHLDDKDGDSPSGDVWTLDGLRSAARLTDQIWPILAQRLQQQLASSKVRGLGAPQEGVEHGFRIGDRVRLAIESDRDGYLLLLDQGPEDILYCLCPSQFAPDRRLNRGLTILPQPTSSYDAFVLSGKPGREQLLAIISDAPLQMNWERTSRIPAHVLNDADVAALMQQLGNMGANHWVALSTYFDIQN
ncbi:MAG: TIR domain-containing protein [Thermoanaerobaculia bacterium]